MRTLFTADTHFGHAGARALYRRPFASVAEMDLAMIARWNEAVAPEDEVWHLGDFAVRHSAEQVIGLLAQLHGRKHLVVGNNDPLTTRSQPGWASVQHYVEITCDGAALVLCHYPFRTWRDMGRGAINLHGHSHGRLKPLPGQFDVGVDARDFGPVTLHELRDARSETSIPHRPSTRRPR
jgi:calcineurin-like phosphoesterase family protein